MTDQPKTRADGARIIIEDERLEKMIERAQHVISEDKKEVPAFWKAKYKKEAAKNWDLFYKRNTTKFFKGNNRSPFFFLSTCSVLISEARSSLD